MQHAPAAASASAATSRTTDWERIGKTLQARLGIDLNLRREQLKDALLDYEDAHPGNNLVGTKGFEFLRHIQNLVWKELDQLRHRDAAEYEAWKRGERGSTWALKTNNSSHAALLKLSESRRFRMSMPGESSGGSDDTLAYPERDLDNLRRTTYNWRKKTTAEWTYQDGRTEKGFPFFQAWDRFDRHGNIDPKGRGGIIGHVNLQWIFGPEWRLAEKQNETGNQTDSNEQQEKNSAIPRLQNRCSEFSEKKEDKRQPQKSGDVFSCVGEKPTTSPEPAHPQQQAENPVKDALSDKKNFAAGVAASDGGAAGGDPAENPAIARAVGLWALLLRLVYAPLFGTGRIRFAASAGYERADFKPFMQKKCVELFAENLHAARKEGEITLDDAAARLTAAIEMQAKYLKDNPEAWLLVPDRFLLTGKAHGTLLSAMQHFVREKERPLLSPEPPENEDSKQRRTRLYNRLLSFGATTQPGLFNRWCLNYRFQHVQAGLDYMAQQIARRRAAGKLPGKEFDNRQGGATAYFARLITSFDSTAVQRETERLERVELKRRLWQSVNGYDNPRNLPPDREIHRQALIALHHRLKSDPELLAIAIREAQAAFDIRFTDDNFLARFENLVLFEHITQHQ